MTGRHWLRDGGRRTDQRGKDGEDTDHECSFNGRACRRILVFKRAATGGGTNDDTSPCMDAICRTSVAVIGRTAGTGRHEHRLHVRRHRPVHSRHFHLVFEIDGAAQAADDQRGAFALGGADHEVGKGDGSRFCSRPRARSACRFRPASSNRSSAEKSGVLPGWVPIASTSRSAKPHGLTHHVKMTVGDGIEGARKERCSRHDAGLTRSARNRKTARAFNDEHRGRPSVEQTNAFAESLPCVQSFTLRRTQVHEAAALRHWSLSKSWSASHSKCPSARQSRRRWQRSSEETALSAPSVSCERQTWPYVDSACSQTGANNASRPVKSV